MPISVRVPAQLRDLAAGAAVVHVEAGTPATVATVLDALATVHPALERRIRDEQGQMRPHINAFVGADNVRDRDGTATPIDDDQELTIIPAVSGG
jgi:molybdopterin converting factor small subunit